MVINVIMTLSLTIGYLVQPRTGHLVQALHVFKYLDVHSKNELAFDLAYHDVEDPALVQGRKQVVTNKNHSFVNPLDAYS